MQTLQGRLEKSTDVLDPSHRSLPRWSALAILNLPHHRVDTGSTLSRFSLVLASSCLLVPQSLL